MIPCMKKAIIFISVIVVLILAGSALWYTFSRSQKIAHNASCEQSTVLCAHEIIPPTLWEVITGKTCDGLLCDNSPLNIPGCDQSATTTPCDAGELNPATAKEDINQYTGGITTDAQGDNIYTSQKYGLSFTYPKGWHAYGGGYIGFGSTLTLLNYDPSDPRSGKGFAEGQNTIGIDVAKGGAIDSILNNTVPEDPVKTKTKEEVLLNGEQAVRMHTIFASGSGRILYVISIPINHIDPAYPEFTHLIVSIGGDRANFSILDNLVKSLRWSEK